MYRNNRDGTLTDVTAKAGGAGKRYGQGLAGGGYAGDGLPDMDVMQHGRSMEYDNKRDGTFTDVSKSSGIGKYLGEAWGVVATDLNNDGKMDLFVANDTTANFLFMNRGSGRFEEVGALAGVGFSEMGRPRSGMGVDA